MTRALLIGAALLLVACGSDDKGAPTTAPSTSGGRPAARTSQTAGDPTKGRQVYLGQCVACHNLDPGKDGPVGPAVRGASRELLEARVVHGTYPPGYRPKRETKVMPPRPDLVASIPDLAAYLQ